MRYDRAAIEERILTASGLKLLRFVLFGERSLGTGRAWRGAVGTCEWLGSLGSVIGPVLWRVAGEADILGPLSQPSRHGRHTGVCCVVAVK